MVVSTTRWRIVTGALLVLVLAFPAAAGDIEDRLSAYTGPNAQGYLGPLVSAFAASLHSGVAHTGYVAKRGGHLSLELVVTGVLFDDEDKTFRATTEDPFQPEQMTDAPTIVGSGTSVSVPGNGGTQFVFPGGFDIGSFGLVIPQLRFGNILGTEGIVRYLAFKASDIELGDVQFFGVGFRHSISQYLGEDYPLDAAIGFLWQDFKVGENSGGNDLVDSEAYSVGIHLSGLVTDNLEPYVGFSWDSFKMDIQYESSSAGTPVLTDVEFETEDTFHLTLGLNLNLAFLSAFGEYSIADRNSFAFGVGFGN